MKILELTETNVKRISFVELKLDGKGGLVHIAGKNENGKSSLFDGIQWALDGLDSVPAKPVRRGQEKAVIEITLGTIGLPELKVRRSFTASGGASLVVMNAEGVKQSTPQAMLDKLKGRLTFDPLEFARMKKAEMSETVLKLLGLDFSKQDAERQIHFDERTNVNRTVKAKEAMLTTNRKCEGVPDEETPIQSVLDEQKVAMESLRQNNEARTQIKSLEDQLSQAKTGITEVEREIKELEAKVKTFRERLTIRQNAQKVLDGKLEQQKSVAAQLVDPDVAAIGTKLSGLEATNQKVRKNKEVAKIETELSAARKESDALTKKIDAIDSAKFEAKAKAKFPVPNMSLDDAGQVQIDGLPFEQASTKGRIIASLAMGAALNPKLRVMMVRSGNDLDTEAIKYVADWAEKQDYQIWIERISTDGAPTLVLEDGHAIDVPSTAEPAKEEAKLL
jgi:DNA repair exonuclease SbcCD ATPase subunit